MDGTRKILFRMFESNNRCTVCSEWIENIKRKNSKYCIACALFVMKEQRLENSKRFNEKRRKEKNERN